MQSKVIVLSGASEGIGEADRAFRQAHRRPLPPERGKGKAADNEHKKENKTMSTQTAEHRPEWIQKASQAIAEMYHQGLAAAERENAQVHARAEHTGAAMREKAESARETMQADAQKAEMALTDSAAHARESLHETQQKIADIIHRHFEQKK
jgi:hypothetical protein